jgi:hypothetical protein
MPEICAGGAEMAQGDSPCPARHEEGVTDPPLRTLFPRIHSADAPQEPRPAGSLPSTLVVIAGNVNYFYDRTGQRIAEALRNLGAEVAVATIRDLPPRDFDCCFLIGLTEIIAGHGDQSDALHRLAGLRSNCRFMAAWNLDSMATRWFGTTCKMLGRVGCDILVDTNVHRQDRLVPRKLRQRYQFVHYGLTHAEREQLVRYRNRQDAAERPIPWATVGHVTHARIALAHRLVAEVDPRGFVYLPPLSPVTRDGPHLNEQQYEAVLRRSRYHVWCAHHGAFYLEGERYRASALSGGVPIKVLHEPPPRDTALPFTYLLLPVENFAPRLRAMDFFQVRERFLAEILALPTLEAELTRFFGEVRAQGVPAAGSTSLSTE